MSMDGASAVASLGISIPLTDPEIVDRDPHRRDAVAVHRHDLQVIVSVMSIWSGCDPPSASPASIRPSMVMWIV